jgi:membrane associated rhomboid family serine protease
MMVAFIILIAVCGVLAYRITSPEDRTRYLEIGFNTIGQLKAAATRPHPESDAYRGTLQARTPHLVITPAIAAINVAVVVCMLLGASAVDQPDTLVRWGASLGPRTTNGEWWRLVSSTFVHTGMLHVFVNVAILIQLGNVLERLVGRAAFAAVYVSAGVYAGLINLSAHPVSVSVGASAAVFGLYGLLLASLVWQMFQSHNVDQDSNTEPIVPSRVTMPLMMMTRLGFGAALFVAYNAVIGFAGVAECGGLIAGLAYGLVLGRRTADQPPRTRRLGVAMAAAGFIAVACAVPLRNIADVKPEIARVIATEEHTAAVYQSALDTFKKGRLTAEALAQLAERTIMPALQAVDLRLETLRNVPPEHRALVSDAREYLRLRCQGWRIRADAIRRMNAAPRRAPNERAAAARARLQAEAQFRSNLSAEGNAEGAERASLEAFQRISR